MRQGEPMLSKVVGSNSAIDIGTVEPQNDKNPLRRKITRHSVTPQLGRKDKKHPP